MWIEYVGTKSVVLGYLITATKEGLEAAEARANAQYLLDDSAKGDRGKARIASRPKMKPLPINSPFVASQPVENEVAIGMGSTCLVSVDQKTRKPIPLPNKKQIGNLTSYSKVLLFVFVFSDFLLNRRNANNE